MDLAVHFCPVGGSEAMEPLDSVPVAAAAVTFADEDLQPVLIFDEYRQQLPQAVADRITAIIQVCPSARRCHCIYNVVIQAHPDGCIANRTTLRAHVNTFLLS